MADDPMILLDILHALGIACSIIKCPLVINYVYIYDINVLLTGQLEY